MAKRPTLPTISATHLSAAQVNTAFDAIKTAFDNTLSLDGSTPNSMNADIDMNSNDLLNVGLIAADDITIDGTNVSGVLERAEDAADRAEAAEVVGFFDSRAAVEAFIAAPNVPVNGRSFFWKGTVARGLTGSTSLPNLPGLAPAGNVANAELLGVTTGTVSDAVALTNAQRINAWLALADCNVFDWRSDEIGIGETIRLGRDGNGIVGYSGAGHFGAATTGARALWQGVSNGTMIRVAHTSDQAINHPFVFGLSLDGNDLAKIGFDFGGYFRMQGGSLHVSGLRNNSASYAYRFGHNVDRVSTSSNCAYGGKFGTLTCAVAGSANGFLFTGRAGSAGENTCFNQFSYCHVTCFNGFSFVFTKGDDNVFTKIGVSRGSGGTSGQVIFNSSAASLYIWVGNIIQNMNLSKTDGSAIIINVSDDRTFGNSTTYNGVDFTPTLTFGGGSLREDNKWTFLGQTDYAGGWTVEPSQNLLPLPNADSTNPKLLDYYLETAPTLVLAFGGASVGITYTQRELNAQRIGNMVSGTAEFILSSKGSSTGNATITALTDASVGFGGSISVGYYSNLAAGITSTPMGTIGGTTITLFKAGAGTAVNMTDADFTNTSRILFSFQYRVA